MNRSLFIKFASIAGIALLILIPLGMIEFKISERSHLRASAETSVAASWTGSQVVSGPMIAIDYEEQHSVQGIDDNGFRFEKHDKLIKKTLYISPVETKLNADMKTDVRKRGIYPLTVFTSSIHYTGHFNNSDIGIAKGNLTKNKSVMSIKEPRIVWHISDPKGLNSVSELQLNQSQYRLLPGSLDSRDPSGLHLPLTKLLLADQQKLEFDLMLELRGMNSLNFIPAGKQTDLELQADWPHPKFVGAFLPASSEITNKHFTASWHVNEYASVPNTLERACDSAFCDNGTVMAFGVELVNPVDIYLQSERAIKYGFLFVALIFIGFIVFELLKKLPVHPVQYALVGFSIAVFFLLLIALSEHINFASAYCVAALASVAIVSLYLRSVLRGWQNAAGFGVALSLLYGLLFMIIQSEDYALLMGASLCFLVLGAVMLVTRHIDWYEIGRKPDNSCSPVPTESGQ